MSNKQVIYNVGMYLRLSKDDGDDIESESITNQRKLIKDYINKNENMKLYDEYADDGYSGANFNRPDFQRLLKDIESKKINMVITKNLARLGRNYIETGNYIEKYFPDHRVRYIALLDNIDNFKESVSNDFVPIKSVFNEKHCRDTSIAVKKTKRRKMEEGYYACNTAPFGYKKDPDTPGKLIIDIDASKTVKKIFDLKLKGYTANEIVKYLDKNKYVTPAEYMKIRGQEHIENKNLWRRSTVNRILCNKVYLGHCVRGKTQNISYKSKDRIFVKRNDFIITKNTHEPIISEEVFEKVHNTKKYGAVKSKNETNYLLKDLIYCKNCGKKLIFKKVRKRVVIYCRNHDENPKLCINNCRLDYFTIENKVFEYISNMYKEYLKNNRVKDNIYKKYTENVIKVLEEDLKQLNISLGQINFRITSLYNQRLSEKVSEDDYKNRYNTLIEQRKDLSDNIADKEKEIKNEKNKLNTLNEKKSILKKIERLDKRDFKNVNFEELIEKIEVFKKEIQVNFNFEEVGKFKV